MKEGDAAEIGADKKIFACFDRIGIISPWNNRRFCSFASDHAVSAAGILLLSPEFAKDV